MLFLNLSCSINFQQDCFYSFCCLAPSFINHRCLPLSPQSQSCLVHPPHHDHSLPLSLHSHNNSLSLLHNHSIPLYLLHSHDNSSLSPAAAATPVSSTSCNLLTILPVTVGHHLRYHHNRKNHPTSSTRRYWSLTLSSQSVMLLFTCYMNGNFVN